MEFKGRNVGIVAEFTGVSLVAAVQQNNGRTIANVHREHLLATTQFWNGKPYTTHYPTGQPQLTTVKVTIPPHTALPWHTHPFPNSAYVLAGTFTLHDQKSGKTLVVRQGQASGESVDAVHSGESGDQNRRVAFTYAGTPGITTSIPANGQKDEY